MAELFAGIAPDGSIRFITEVARGAACNCRCPECESPLVAKQGVEKAWHFAHEGGQERPECEVGAANLLRRIAIEELKSRPMLEPPTYRRSLNASLGTQTWSETVELTSQRAAPWRWLEAPPRRSPVALTTLADGVALQLHVDVTEAAATPVNAATTAVLSFLLPLPGLDALQTRLAAERYVREAGSLQWRHRPDPDGALAAAQERLQHHQSDAQVALNAELSAEADRRRQLERAARAEVEAEEMRRSAVVAETRSRGAAITASMAQWAPQRDGKSSFLYYRLKDGTSWVVYAMVDGAAGVVAWPPDAVDRQTLPTTVAAFDEELKVYRTTHAAAIMYLRSRQAFLRTTSDPAELAQWSALGRDAS